MAIRTSNPTSNPMLHCCVACAQDIETVNIPTEIRELAFCICDYFCKYEEPVFGNLPDLEDEYKNDKSSFVDSLTHSSSTVEAKLI